jgi:transposase-like protein
MTEHDSAFLQRLVVGSKRDGRRRYDKQAKAELVQACLKPGVSVARVALKHGINANLLRKWITLHLQKQEQSPVAAAQFVAPSPSPFVPVVPTGSCGKRAEPGLRVRLPNGIEISLSGHGEDALSSLLRLLCTLPCSASTPH